MNAPLPPLSGTVLGTGSYTATEAGRLLKTAPRNIRRWMGGYTFVNNGATSHSAALWTPELPRFQGAEDQIEIGFRDLIELRFVKAFMDAGLGLKMIRACLEVAREYVDDARPFSTRRFRTDGRTIFLETAQRSGTAELLDLKKKQYTFRDVVERTFKDLDIEDDIVRRWRAFGGKNSIVLDPRRAFGQPIASDSGVPTVALADAVEAEGSVAAAARFFEVPISVVRDAVAFEQSLRSA